MRGKVREGSTGHGVRAFLSRHARLLLGLPSIRRNAFRHLKDNSRPIERAVPFIYPQDVHYWTSNDARAPISNTSFHRVSGRYASSLTAKIPGLRGRWVPRQPRIEFQVYLLIHIKDLNMSLVGTIFFHLRLWDVCWNINNCF